MAIIQNATIQQSTIEIRGWTVDFTDDLPTGVTVSAGSAVHTPPSGAAVTPTYGTSGTTVTATIGPLSVVGIHYLDVIATFSNSEKSAVRVVIPVNYPTAISRSTMADLVGELRTLTNADANEYTVAGVPFWTDKQLQTVLDRHVTYVKDYQLRPEETLESGGSVAYYDYQSPYRFFESTDAGTARFIVKDETYATVGTAAYSVDYPRGRITFGTTTAGLTRYLTGFSYDMNAAAADVWTMKASNAGKMFNFSTDNMRVDRGAFQKNCFDMANYYRGLAPPTVIQLYREDTRP